jgi:hypothetical protein
MKRVASLIVGVAVAALLLAAAPRNAAVSRAQREWVRANPACAVCGLRSIHLWRCEAHHINPYHLRPDLGACPTNFVTLCRAHHWLVGHGARSWSYENTNVLATIRGVRAVCGLDAP